MSQQRHDPLEERASSSRARRDSSAHTLVRRLLELGFDVHACAPTTPTRSRCRPSSASKPLSARRGGGRIAAFERRGKAASGEGGHRPCPYCAATYRKARPELRKMLEEPSLRPAIRVAHGRIEEFTPRRARRVPPWFTQGLDDGPWFTQGSMVDAARGCVNRLPVLEGLRRLWTASP